MDYQEKLEKIIRQTHFSSQSLDELTHEELYDDTPAECQNIINQAIAAITALNKDDITEQTRLARELLEEKYKKLAAGIFAVKPYLDKPYPDDPRWTPYTRFIEPRMKMMHEAIEGNDIGQLAAMAQLAPKPEKGPEHE
jgi:hypothetical protein